MKRLTALLLICALSSTALAQGNQFRVADYKGGTLPAKSNRGEMTVTPELITFRLQSGEQIEFTPKGVTAISYGKEASRRVATWVTLGIVLTPLALFGLFAKKQHHYIGVEFVTPAGKPGGVLFRSDKKEYRALLTALRSTTGQAVVGYDDKGKGVKESKGGGEWWKIEDGK